MDIKEIIKRLQLLNYSTVAREIPCTRAFISLIALGKYTPREEMTAKLIKAINAVEANNAVKIKLELETSQQNIKEKIIHHEAALDKLKKRMESLERE